MKLTPYINFSGNAEEAIDFYAKVLGGNVISLSRYGDSPMPVDEDYKQKIIYGRLQFGDNIVMVSDVFKGQTVQTGGNIQLSIEVTEEGQIDEVFFKNGRG